MAAVLSLRSWLQTVPYGVSKARTVLLVPGRGLSGGVILNGSKFQKEFFDIEVNNSNKRATLAPKIAKKAQIGDEWEAAELCEKVLKFLAGPGRKIRPALVINIAQSLKEPNDVSHLKQILARFRQKNILLNSRCNSEILKGLCRINQTDQALFILMDPRQYGVIPDLRNLNSLVLRLGSEAKNDTSRLKKVIDLWNLFGKFNVEPNYQTRAFLLRAGILSHSPEGATFALKILQSPDTPKDISKQIYLFWVIRLLKAIQSNPDLYKDVAKPIYELLIELKKIEDVKFPPILEVFMSQKQ